MKDVWSERRKYFIERLLKENSEGRVDKDILELLMLINSHENYYSLSSCSGRVQIIEGKSYSDRKNIKSIAKFHYGVDKHELIKAIENIEGDFAWISLQPPIVHIACKSFDDALKILKEARGSGFKHSGIISRNPDRVVVELNSSNRLDIPLKYEGKFIVNLNEIDTLIKILEENLKAAKLSINKLMSKFSKLLNGSEYKASKG